MLLTLLDAVLLTLPIVIGGVAHMYAVSRQWLPALARPVNRRAFGANKTWRGFVLMPLLTIPGAYALGALLPLNPRVDGWLAGTPLWLLGLALGLGYILLELPNSFLKRRLGIAPGETPGRGAWFFILLDQWDSAIGFALAYALLTPVPASVLLVQVLIFPAIALAVKRLLYMARWKEKYL